MPAYLLLPVFALLTLLSACSPSAGPETEIRQVIEQMQTALDDRDNAGVRRHIAENFIGGPRGGAQLEREDVRKLLAGYFLRYRDIRLLITQLEIEADPGQPELASMRGTAALSGAAQRLPETARLYRFEGRWRRIDGDWQLVRCHWQ
ncbi:YybH family protein [Pseudohalioglobus sediminis]|nr:nuclear transport factor 2 family protein [Pseudohalioglobus sediminis]